MSNRGITVRAVLAKAEAFGLAVELLSGGDGLDGVVTSPHLQKTGLALAGFHEYLQPGRILLFGQSEIRYLESLPSNARTETLRRAFARPIPCLVLTGGFNPPPELLLESERATVPVVLTQLATPTAIAKLTAALDDILAERTTIHAVLMDILGLGVLIVGESGIGKSECALDLVARGHRLVADDTVEIRRRAETILIGTCPELTRNHMEIRGLGLINVRDLFGVASIRSSKRVELVVRLERWEVGREYERLGIDESFYEILGLRVPLVT
ncbi:MAG: HPr(Ser) kinase/phosphatase, partial [Acidobacteria bacterium]